MAATAAVYNRLHNSSLLGVGGGSGGGGVGVGAGGGGGGGHHSQLARSLERILDEAHHSGELILTNRKLKDFPKTPTKYNLTDTVIADLSRNRFCELPEEVTTFSFLETLLLYHNTIRSIPESVKQLTSLTYLDLRSNQLSTLPREICFLPLQVLLVSNNRLTALPDELGRMDRLTDLDAAYNQLSSLPARIGELRSLRSFSLRSNQLMYLPRELTCLTLVSLDVSNNRISSLPLEIRQMSTLVEFNLENNPLTSPPASLCVRGLVHVFKFLETQAVKDEKGSRAGGNYDGYTTLRRAPRHNSSGNVLESNRVPRHHVDSGYSTCDGIDKRWSHDMPSTKPKSVSPVRKTPPTPPSSLVATLMDASLSSSTSTIVDEPITADSPILGRSNNVVDSNNFAQQSQSPSKQQQQQRAQPLHQHINYAHSNSSSNGSSPDQEDMLIDQQSAGGGQQSHSKSDDKINKNLGNIQTYREYKEALKQQRNQEISSVYKNKGQKTLYDMNEASNALNCNAEQSEERSNGGGGGDGNNSSPSNSSPVPSVNGGNGIVSGTATLPKSIMKNGTGMNGISGNNTSNGGGGGDDSVVIPKKPIQKVIPSRYTDATQTRINAADTNGDCLVGGYVKPNSPLKTVNGGILTNNNGTNAKFGGSAAGNNAKSPVGGAAGKLGGVVAPTTAATTATATKNRVTWNHDIPSEKLSFTMRREFDRQREETELMTQLRSIIETRLKMTLPEDIASALTDGVILCHLANYVRPRSVASIHVPSPGVSKLTMARCRRNVENFLEACLKIGVDEELICSSADVVPAYDSEDADDLLSSLIDDNSPFNSLVDNNNDKNIRKDITHKRTLPNPSAVLKTVAALIALDCNPHHQNIRNLQQQQELQEKLQKYEQREEQMKSATLKQPPQHQQPQQQQQQHQQHYQQNHARNGRASVVEQQQQQHYEQVQQTATRTKKQPLQQQPQPQQQQQQRPQNAFVANMEFNSTFNFQTSNGNDNHDVDDDRDFVDNVEDDDDVDGDDVVVNHQQQQQHQHQQAANVVGNFLRHAKLKTFQKIKLNLIPTHLSGSGKSNCSMLTAATTTTLQTIVETENDVLGGVGNNVTLEEEANIRNAAGGGGYQLINERSQQFSSNNNNNNSNTCTISSNNKYKLLELPSLDLSSNGGSVSSSDVTKNVVSKRIEFFEHSSSTAGNGSPPEVEIKSKIKNGGNGVVGSIFSIYRVSDLANLDNKLQNVVQLQEQQQHLGQQQHHHQNHHSHPPLHSHLSQPKLTKEAAKTGVAASPLLKHDSYVLTVILSCVFIVTFLLLVFFPLPG